MEMTERQDKKGIDLREAVRLMGMEVGEEISAPSWVPYCSGILRVVGGWFYYFELPIPPKTYHGEMGVRTTTGTSTFTTTGAYIHSSGGGSSTVAEVQPAPISLREEGLSREHRVVFVPLPEGGDPCLKPLGFVEK